MLAVVSDSSPLIYLTRLGRLPLLRECFDRSFVPLAVWDEVAVRGWGLPESVALREAVAEGWIQVRRPGGNAADLGKAAESLGRADAEAVLLARELGALLLTDDAEVREAAASVALRVTGTVGLLLRAKRERKIGQLKPLLELLRARTNFRMSDTLYQTVLREAGED